MNLSLRDQLNMYSDCKQAASLAFRMIDAIQDDRAGAQVNSITLLFLMLCEVAEVDPREQFNRINRTIQDDNGDLVPEVRALKSYIKSELIK